MCIILVVIQRFYWFRTGNLQQLTGQFDNFWDTRVREDIEVLGGEGLNLGWIAQATV
jgi:hypothetical protein